MKDLYSLEEVKEMEATKVAEIVKRGIRTGSEFKLVRKVAGFRANDIAMLLDVAAETVSRWESGKVALPRTALFALAELYERPVVTRKKLEALAG
jgi:transcriptional regulator with XRE-family HTH domain